MPIKVSEIKKKKEKPTPVIVRVFKILEGNIGNAYFLQELSKMLGIAPANLSRQIYRMGRIFDTLGYRFPIITEQYWKQGGYTRVYYWDDGTTVELQKLEKKRKYKKRGPYKKRVKLKVVPKQTPFKEQIPFKERSPFKETKKTRGRPRTIRKIIQRIPEAVSERKRIGLLAFQMFDDNRTDSEVMDELGLSLNVVNVYRQEWEKQKLKKPVKRPLSLKEIKLLKKELDDSKIKSMGTFKRAKKIKELMKKYNIPKSQIEYWIYHEPQNESIEDTKEAEDDIWEDTDDW